MAKKPEFTRFAKNSMPFLLALVLAFAVAVTFLGNWDTSLMTELERIVDWKYVGQASLEDAKADLEAEKQAIESEKQALQATKEELAEALSKAEELLGQLNAIKKDTQELIEKAEQEGAAVTDKIGELKDAYEKLESLEQQRWILPIQYEYVSSYFGYRNHPVDDVVKFHSGVDLAANYGVPIVASRSGTIKNTGYEADGAGYYVVIDHLDGYKTSYLHMARYIVEPGQFVVAGQIIGYCGSTGKSTGPHLHFNVLYNNEYVDPENYIDLK